MPSFFLQLGMASLSDAIISLLYLRERSFPDYRTLVNIVSMPKLSNSSNLVKRFQTVFYILHRPKLRRQATLKLLGLC